MEILPLSEIRIEISEAGLGRTFIGTDDAADLAAAHRLLARVAPELRALDKALREPPVCAHGRTGDHHDFLGCEGCGEDVEGRNIDGWPK